MALLDNLQEEEQKRGLWQQERELVANPHVQGKGHRGPAKDVGPAQLSDTDGTVIYARYMLIYTRTYANRH